VLIFSERCEVENVSAPVKLMIPLNRYNRIAMKEVLRRFIEKFEKFDEDEITAIVENTQVESFPKGTIVLQEGTICNKCYFVLQGCLRQYQLVSEEEKTTGFFLEGQPAVLYSSYLQNRPSEYYLSCVEDCILITGTREQEEELHKKYPKLEYLSHVFMLQDYNKVESHLALLNAHKPEDRYLILLKTQPELLNRAPLHQIASYIGVTAESLSRIRKRVLKNDRR
jgi:CRP-like cAMP-binding protein